MNLVLSVCTGISTCLNVKGFWEKVDQLIPICISIVKLSFIINGSPKVSSLSRQGEPLSIFFIAFVMEGLSRMLVTVCKDAINVLIQVSGSRRKCTSHTFFMQILWFSVSQEKIFTCM